MPNMLYNAPGWTRSAVVIRLRVHASVGSPPSTTQCRQLQSADSSSPSCSSRLITSPNAKFGAHVK
eukprot:scaffold23173_cov78-Phaeocystis_antarctica.AAC.2